MKQEKGSLHRAMTTFRIAYFGGIVLYMLGGAGILGMIGGLIYGSQAIRCPHCGGGLTVGRLPGVPRYCPYCGEALKEE